MRKIDVLLLTNYRSDDQRSMLRFGNLLVENLPSNGINVHEIHPKDCFRRFALHPKLRKWAGYVDKYLLFPRVLSGYGKSILSRIDVTHVIDHSNAIYFPRLMKAFKATNLITCHDLIAIRTALGEFEKAPPTSSLGRSLQNRILNSLSKAHYYACDSRCTMNDLNRLVKNSRGKSQVIHLGTEANKSVMKDSFPCKSQTFDPLKNQYLLHVGSGAWYKNRESIFEAFKAMRGNGTHSNLHLVLVGPPPQMHETNQELRFWIDENTHCIHSFDKVLEVDLGILYAHARVLLFPSHIEGFGWPPLEAASHGIPVITTKTGAMADILGENALYVDPNDRVELEKAIQKALISPPQPRSSLSIPGNRECVQNYSSLYRKMSHRGND